MSRARDDEAGDPGKAGRWKDGFNLDCGMPAPLLVERRASGPWQVVENVRAPKNRFYVAKPVGSYTLSDVFDMKRVPVAWIGADRMTAERLAERFNGYELARDFPPELDISFDGPATPLGREMP